MPVEDCKKLTFSLASVLEGAKRNVLAALTCPSDAVPLLPRKSSVVELTITIIPRIATPTRKVLRIMEVIAMSFFYSYLECQFLFNSKLPFPRVISRSGGVHSSTCHTRLYAPDRRDATYHVLPSTSACTAVTTHASRRNIILIGLRHLIFLYSPIILSYRHIPLPLFFM